MPRRGTARSYGKHDLVLNASRPRVHKALGSMDLVPDGPELCAESEDKCRGLNHCEGRCPRSGGGQAAPEFRGGSGGEVSRGRWDPSRPPKHGRGLNK